MKFQVNVKEVWTRSFTIEAESEEQATELANQKIEAGDQEDEFDYSHTLDVDKWDVYPVK